MEKEADYIVHDPEIETHLKEIGGRIKTVLDGTGYGFALLIFSFGPEGNMFYCSNAERQTMCDAMREFIAKNELN